MYAYYYLQYRLYYNIVFDLLVPTNTQYIYIILYSFRWRIRWRRVHDRWRCVYIRALCHKYYYIIIYRNMFFDPTTLDASGFCQFPVGRLSRAPISHPSPPLTTKISGRKKVLLPSLPLYSHSPPFFCDELLRYYMDGSAVI